MPGLNMFCLLIGATIMSARPYGKTGNEIKLFPCLYTLLFRLYMYRRPDRESVVAAESAYMEQSR